MTQLAMHLSADKWLLQFFGSKAAISGGVIRRQRNDIDRLVGWDRFERELRKRGYHCFENAGQVIVICNQEPVRVIC